MALYVLGDPHLSLGSSKPMDVFGGVWDGYVDKLKEGLSALQDEDVLILAGDVSWGMSLEQSEADFAWLDAVPGTKILLKGNHDYWWGTVSKMEKFFAEKGFTTFRFLHNNCHFYGDIAICGTRGWFFEEDKPGQSSKVFNRELLRLETSLKAAGDKEIWCFLHYPPLYTGYRCQPVLDLLKKYNVKRCYYGHLHGGSHRLAFQGVHEGTEFRLVAADYLRFYPEKIKESAN